MRSYLNYLLTDIQNGHKPINPPEKALTFEEEMELVEDWAQGRKPVQSLSQLCGLIPENFLPANRLTEEELQTVINAFHEMLSSWHLQADIPETMPINRVYPLLINILNKEAWYFPHGAYHYDFCTGYAPDCELKEYCPCLKNGNEPSIDFYE